MIMCVLFKFHMEHFSNCTFLAVATDRMNQPIFIKSSPFPSNLKEIWTAHWRNLIVKSVFHFIDRDVRIGACLSYTVIKIETSVSKNNSDKATQRARLFSGTLAIILRSNIEVTESPIPVDFECRKPSAGDFRVMIG